MIEIILNTRNTLTNRAIRARSVLSAGIKLTRTISVSNQFQKLLKKCFLTGSAKNRIVSSTRKNALINQSSKRVIEPTVGGMSYVLAPTNNAETIMTVITKSSKTLLDRIRSNLACSSLACISSKCCFLVESLAILAGFITTRECVSWMSLSVLCKEN